MRSMRVIFINYVAGILMMVTGIAGAVVAFFYDKLIVRPMNLGFWQVIGILYFLFVAYVGYLLDDYTKDFRGTF